jgi:peptidyl-tRNA hydrolase
MRVSVWLPFASTSLAAQSRWPATRTRSGGGTCGARMAASAAEHAVQYVVVRRDLGWPAGSVAAQAVHACMAAVWNARDHPDTAAYCNPDADAGAQMHTVVLETGGADALVRLADELGRAGIDHVLWTEHPENIVTALAAKPYPRSIVQPHFKKFKLFK